MSSTTTTSISFKPWLSANNDSHKLQDVLARVNIERGHFRDVTEASLQEELANEGALELSDSDDEDAQDGEGAKDRKQPTTRQELYAVKNEIWTRLNDAHQEVMLGLDLMSLLESRYSPAQAKPSISQALVAAAPVGSLAADVWHRTPQDRAREAQDNLLANKVRMRHLQESADDLLAASKRLEDNVRKETVFWDQVLGISEKGWNVSRIPLGQKSQQRLLGVHFGFSGSALEFARRDVAALITDTEGSISLERGIGSKPKALRAVVKKDGKIMGCSKLPALLDHKETTLEARIRHARDSLYDEELYHEALREARTLASMGITTNASAISFAAGVSRDLSFELELLAIDEQHDLPIDASGESDDVAQALLLAARLLLSQAHRDSIRKQSQPPPPMTDKKQERTPFAILRPLLLLTKQQASMYQINAYLDKLSALCAKVHISVDITNSRASLPDLENDRLSADILLKTLSQPVALPASIKLKNDEPVTISTTGLSFQLTVPAEGDGPAKQVMFGNFEDLALAVDDWLGGAVARELLLNVFSWQFEENAQGLVRAANKTGDNPDERDVALVTVEGLQGTIALGVNGETKFTWRLEGTSEVRSLQDCLNEI